MKSSARVEILVAVVCLALGILYIVQGLEMPTGGPLTRGGFGPGTLPTVMGVVMAFAGLLYLGGQVRALQGAKSALLRSPGADSLRSSGPRPPVRANPWKRARRSPVLMALLVALYLLLLPWVGFFTTTAVLLLGLFTIVDVLTWPMRVGITLGFLGLAYLLFDQLLGVAFPIGYAGL